MTPTQKGSLRKLVASHTGANMRTAGSPRCGGRPGCVQKHPWHTNKSEGKQVQRAGSVAQLALTTRYAIRRLFGAPLLAA
jgi:hypothetical protein